MKIEAIVNKCRELRSSFERDEARFFLGLVEIEKKHMAVISGAGHDSFEQFLKRNELCEPVRYRSFSKGLSYTTREKALEMGTHAVMELASTHEPENVRKYEAAVGAWQREHGGVAPSRETVRRILRQVDPRAETPQVLRNAQRETSEVNRLRAENADLKAEVSGLRKKVKTLEKELSRRAKAKPRDDQPRAPS